jgi:hypothetical protein
MKIVLLAASAMIVAAAACSSTSARRGSDTSNACPSEVLPACPAASSAACMNGDPSIGCTPAGLPSGLACEGSAQCSMAVYPCAGELQSFVGTGSVDGYVCSCVDSRWSCDDCAPGGAVCSDSDAETSGGDVAADASASTPDSAMGDCLADSSPSFTCARMPADATTD